MNIDEYDAERESSAPIEMLEHYFTALGWACERTGEEEIVSSFQGSWTQYELRAIWREEDQVLQFLALPDIRVAADKRAAVYETIGLVNEIGRASCRERVEISVVGVSLKKKKR